MFDYFVSCMLGVLQLSHGSNLYSKNIDRFVALARTLNSGTDVSATYGCLHQRIIGTYRHARKNTIGQSDNDVVM